MVKIGNEIHAPISGDEPFHYHSLPNTVSNFQTISFNIPSSLFFSKKTFKKSYIFQPHHEKCNIFHDKRCRRQISSDFAFHWPYGKLKDIALSQRTGTAESRDLP